jgi:hypothetical protein
MCVSRILLKNNLVHRVATHTAQRPLEQVTKDAKGYLKLVVPKWCVGRTRDQRFMYNMDQTNTYFAHAPKTSINECGTHTINMHIGANDSKRCTVVCTITASGEIIKPMVIYAGTRGVRIATHELPQHPQDMHYAVQKKAWFDEVTMLEWVEKVLAPDVPKDPVGIIPVLFLDSFKVHLLGSVANAIQKLGIEIEYIPAGCTGLDVGFNKPYKSNMKKVYTYWLMSQGANSPFHSPSRQEVSAWVIEAVGGISAETVQKAWCKTGYSYFE